MVLIQTAFSSAVKLQAGSETRISGSTSSTTTRPLKLPNHSKHRPYLLPQSFAHWTGGPSAFRRQRRARRRIQANLGRVLRICYSSLRSFQSKVPIGRLEYNISKFVKFVISFIFGESIQKCYLFSLFLYGLRI
jgi:hypothetical protein